MMHLASYLKRINYVGVVNPDLPTLIAVHRAHLLSITYENLDIHRNCPLTVDEVQIYEKIVANGRGGWCFEMNGLLAWALREIGFDVTLMSSFVGRDKDSAIPQGAGDHLILLVRLDKPYLADVGFGNGILEPLPLEAGTYQQGFLTFRLSREDDRWWFYNHARGGEGFDFNLNPFQLSDFAGQSTRLQTSPESGFVRTTVCLRFQEAAHLSLRGAVFRTLTAHGERDEIITNASRYKDVLSSQFDLHLPEVIELWEKVWARHQAWIKSQQ